MDKTKQNKTTPQKQHTGKQKQNDSHNKQFPYVLFFIFYFEEIQVRLTAYERALCILTVKYLNVFVPLRNLEPL